MKDASVLKDIFAKYAGKEIKNPHRLTCDCDDVADGLLQKVREAGFISGGLYEKGVPVMGCMAPPHMVTAEYESSRDGKLRLTGNFKLG